MLGDRLIKLPACFCHFPATDPEIAKVCENRVAGYTQQEIDKAKAIARNQRLRLLQRWFWSVYTRFHDNRDEAPVSVMTELITAGVAEGGSAKPIDFAIDLIERSIDGESGVLKHHLNDLLFRHVPESAPTATSFYKKLSKIDLEFHAEICHEVFAFLRAGRQQGILKDVVLHAIAYFVIENIVNGDGTITWSNVLERHSSKFAMECLGKFIWLITIIPWSEEFEKLG